MAANWEWGSNFAISADYNDNPALVPADRKPESTFRILGIYNGEFVRLSSNSVLEFRPRVTRDYYPKKDQKRLESTDFFLPGNYRLIRPRTSWSLGYNLSRQNVLSDEQTLETGGLNQLNADDTLYRASLTPGMSWIMSQKDTLFLSLSANSATYSLPNTNRADSIGGGINASYTRSLTQRQSLGFTTSYLLYKSDNSRLVPLAVGDPPVIQIFAIDTVNDSKSTSVTLDWGFRTSDTSNLNLKIGLQDTEVTNKTTETDTGLPLPFGNATTPFTSTTYNISYRKTLEKGAYNINLTRGVAPAANGQPQDRYQLIFAGDTRLTEKLIGRWRFSASQQESIVVAATDGVISRKNRNYNSDLRLIWTITRKWNASIIYALRYADRDARLSSEAVTAQSNQVAVGINYVWKSIQR